MKRVIAPLAFAIFVLLVWQICASAYHIPEFLLPSPLRLVVQLKEDSIYLGKECLVTLVEAVFGLLLAIFAGFLLGTVFSLWNSLERMVMPYAIASQAVPVVATAPLLILYLGSGVASKIAMAALICFFPMVVSSTKGLRSVTREQLALMYVFRASRWQTFWKLRLPSSVSHVFSGMRVSAALAMIGAIVAEYAGADRGLGYVIMQATYHVDTPRLFSAILYSALGGWVLFAVVAVIDKTVLKHYGNMG